MTPTLSSAQARRLFLAAQGLCDDPARPAKPRFARWEKRARRMRWFEARLGARPERTIARVHERIAREGGLYARDFERKRRPATGWWDGTPEKTALEFLWRTGRRRCRWRRRRRGVARRCRPAGSPR